MKFEDIPQFIRSSYSIDVHWSQLEWTLEGFKKDYGLDMEPDFQRGHVWDDAKRIAYVEFVLRGGQSGKALYFNCPGFDDGGKIDTMVMVDGFQRINAALKFMHNEIPVFGYKIKEFENDKMRGHVARFHVNVNSLKTRKEVLQWYLDLNTGGVVHSDSEIKKVKKLLEQEQSK